MNMDIPKEIRRAVDTGTVTFGFRSAEKNILKGKGEIGIISKNCPKRLSERIQHISRIAGIPFFEFEGSALELGSICGKPFLVSILLVFDKGKSRVLELSGLAAPKKTAKPAKKRKPITKKIPHKTKPKRKKPAPKNKSIHKAKKTESKKRR